MPSRVFIVRTRASDVDAVSDLLRGAGFGDIVENERRGCVELSTALASDASEARAQSEFVARCDGGGFEVHTCWEELDDDWQLAWTRQLEPVQITPSLRLVPGLPSGVRKRGEIYLEPALTFGFGEHPTTRMALRFLSSRVRPHSTVLDVGTGSGVLALSAAYLGARHATGIDIDAVSVAAARRNAVTNDLAARCTFSSAQLGSVESEFSVVVANIDAQTLRGMAQDLSTRVGPGGCIGITGVLDEQQTDVIEAFSDAGIELKRIDAEGDWVLLGANI